MERLLSVIFPCCFPTRRFSSAPHERTPLLHDSGASSQRPSSDSGIATPGSDGKRVKRKHNSILPAPAYDAQALRGIMEDFRGKLIAVETGERGEKWLLGGGAVEGQESSEAIATKRLTPVHTLRLAVTASSSHVPAAAEPKLVDIWSTSPTPSTAPSNTILSYSAAVKRGSATAKPKGKRFSSASKGNSTATGKKAEASVEQRAYETLAELARAKPLVHDWELDESEDAKA